MTVSDNLRPASEGLLPGFGDPVFDAQSVFRAALNATAYPGRIFELADGIAPPAPFDPATGALALTLLDMETTLWLDPASDAARTWLGFHAGVAVTDKQAEARFVIVTDLQSLPRIDALLQGSDEYPDRSATLIVQVPSLDGGPVRNWRGPGINGSLEVGVAGLADAFWAQRDLNREIYPAGIDIFLTCGKALMGLPRTTIVEG